MAPLGPPNGGLNKTGNLACTKLPFELFSVKVQRIMRALRRHFLHLNHPEVDLLVRLPQRVTRFDDVTIRTRQLFHKNEIG